MTDPATVNRLDITLRSAGDQAAAVRNGEISARELLAAVIGRYHRFNPAINAVVVTRIEEAEARAQAADEATARGESWGPLHGVPITIKEPWDWVGTPSTSGYEDRVDWRPERNCEVVDRLLDAGAIIYGKTNIPVGMADWQTFNPVYGTTNNPWDLDRMPGGSSGGSAAALATGMTALEVGSDIGASIRNPAHYCGVFGHKPTYGLVPTAGHGAPGDPTELDIGVGGPLARSASDLRLGLDTVAGAGGLDAAGWRLDLPEPTWTRPEEIRAAVMLESPCVMQDQELTDQLAATVEALASLGVKVDHDGRPDIDIERSHEVYLMLLRAATGTESPLDKFEAMKRPAARYADGDRDYQAIVGHSITMSHWEWAALHRERTHQQHAWAEFFTDYDMLLCPTAASAAYPHDQQGNRADRTIPVNGDRESTIDQLFWAGWSCGVYLPGAVATAGLTASGLPCGLQIVTGHLQDYSAIAFAALMERELGGYQVPPGYE
ncbi:MAG: amidase [Acidimicrobiia bacterium]|nr:amidase [Acidimicrobiia bacterium]